MSIITLPYIFSAGNTIIASQHNSNFSVIYNDYDGNITSANIAPSAGILYSQLSLGGNIVNADINASAGIVASKLVLTSPGSIGSVSPNTGAFTTLNVGTTNQGDVLYDNGTTFTRLTPGTNGQFLQTQGPSSNPQWSTVSQAFTLVSATNVSNSAGTGNIAITQGNIYQVIVIGTNTATALTPALRFNADTGNNYNGASSIKIGATGSQNVGWVCNFYIYPNPLSVNDALVTGTSAAVTTTYTSAGVYTGSATITEFNIFDSQSASNWTGTVYLYQISI